MVGTMSLPGCKLTALRVPNNLLDPHDPMMTVLTDSQIFPPVFGSVDIHLIMSTGAAKAWLSFIVLQTIEEIMENDKLILDALRQHIVNWWDTLKDEANLGGMQIGRYKACCVGTVETGFPNRDVQQNAERSLWLDARGGWGRSNEA